MVFKGLQVDRDASSHKNTVLLQEIDGNRELTIELGAMEGMALSLVLHQEALPRPLTHDLILLCLKALQAQFLQAEITAFKEGLFYAAIEFRQNHKRIRIDCRPSDALTLALRTNKPIFAMDSVLEAVAGKIDESGSKTHVPPLHIPDAAADMVRRVSAGHVLDIMNASPHRGSIAIDEDDPKQKERLLDLLRCLEPSTRQKM